MLYCILQRTLDLRTYALDDISWASSLQVCSFVFNTVLVDDRPGIERLAAPRVLDVGMAEATIPDVLPRSPIHVRGSWNAYLSRGNRGVSRHALVSGLITEAYSRISRMGQQRNWTVTPPIRE